MPFLQNKHCRVLLFPLRMCADFLILHLAQKILSVGFCVFLNLHNMNKSNCDLLLFSAVFIQGLVHAW